MEKGQISTDLTVIFPTTSLSGNKYILILYDYDSNSVLSAPMKNRGDKETVCVFDLLIQSLIIHRLQPSLHRLENEAYLAISHYHIKQGIDYRVAPPHIHHRNNSEYAIQTFKNHFITGLCPVDPSFPLKSWDKFLPQATILSISCANHVLTHACPPMPNSMDIMISTGPPWRPPGSRIIAHEKPDQWASWDPREVDGYYLGPALDHYTFYQVHITKTKGTIIVDTVEFFPSKTAMPQTSSNDLSTIADLELSNTLQKPSPAAPLSHIGTSQLQAVRQLSDIFTAALPPTITQHAPPMSQASSQCRNTIPPAPVYMLGSPRQEPTYIATPHQSPRLAPYPSPRVSPGQAPSPRGAPRVNPMNVASPRVNPTLCHSMDTTSMKYCLIYVVIYITTI
jgi:hypothetical protein